MEALTAEQLKIGKVIEQIITNYKKDSPSRKTLEYLKRRQASLEAEWTKFLANDKKLQEFSTTHAEHAYFKNNYVAQVQAGYEALRDQIAELINSGSSQQTDPTASSSEDKDKVKLNPQQQDEFSFNNGEEVPDEELSKLVRKQKALIATLTKHLHEIELAREQAHPKHYYELKITVINKYWSDISMNNQTIWAIATNSEPMGYKMDFYVEAELWVHEILIELSQRLDQFSSIPNQHGPQMKLPKIVIPVFDGNYLKWKQFCDLYTQMIHNQQMSNSQKMFYLISNLTGEAKSLVSHLPISEENYISSWEILQNRYNNKRLLVIALLNKLLSQPPIQIESATSLKTMHDITKECLLGLQNMGIETSVWDPIVLHLMIKKLDRTTHGLYEQSLENPRELQSMAAFLNFLELRFQSLEALGNKIGTRQNSKRLSPMIGATALLCISCKRDHPLFSCEKFLRLSPKDRLSFLKKNKLCINCLKSGHTVSKCTSRGCPKCSGKHNSLVHFGEQDLSKEARSEPTSTSEIPAETSHSLPVSINEPLSLAATSSDPTQPETKKYIFLATALIRILDKYNQPVECRAVLDSGSQSNFISERLWTKLGLRYVNDKMNILGIGNSRHRAEKRVNITLQSCSSGYATRLEAFVLPSIASNQPQRYVDIKDWPIPANIQLADPHFNVPQRIDVLIGAEIYASLMSVGQIRMSDSLPTLQNSVLGWVIMGKATHSQGTNIFCGLGNASKNIDAQIERFWTLEEAESTTRPMTVAEKYCEEHFKKTTLRDKDGKFIVRFPFSQDPSSLGESKELAMRRFFSIERKLGKNAELREQYVAFMREYEELNHMERIDPKSISSSHYFIPHHCVLKPDSSTTKLRVVFDASSKTTTNIALNEILYNGPTIQDDLFAILIRFRLHKYVFTADIEKMYRQIWVNDKDQNLQLIIWRNRPDQRLKYYRLKTVTYGTTSAPYLAIKCLQTLAEENLETHPLGANIAFHDFYVDDVMTGSDSLKEALEMQKQLTQLLKLGGFRLRKWCSNKPELLRHIPKEDIEPKLDLNHEGVGHIKTLGMTWWPHSDIFAIQPNQTDWSVNTKITKRTVLSDIAHLFDPLGIVNPVIVQAKIFLQKLWLLKLDWDAALPLELHTKWIKFRNELKDLDNIKIPRHVCCKNKIKSMEIHGFADASEKAYGAVVYVKTTDNNGLVTVRLLCSKSRVAPTKTTTLPRLELCAAKLLAQLVDRLHKIMQTSDQDTYYWTDSKVVLSWLQAESSSFKTFVANRVASIQGLSNVQRWNHVNTKENPADLVSRGAYPSQLLSKELWFNGPHFLSSPKIEWPITHTSEDVDDIEKKVPLTSLMTTKCDIPILGSVNHRNSFLCLQRITAYVLRFIRNTRTQRNKRITTIPPNINELEEAMEVIIKHIQLNFEDELGELKKKQNLRGTSKIASLTPFLDSRGIIRVGGRLEASTLSFDAKHPMLLSDSHPFTKLLLNHLHIQHLHCGPQALLALTRQRFWPLKGRILTRSIVHHCMKCAKAKPRPLSQLMGNLPSTRVQPARPFINAGVDFCGPIWTHYRVRGKRPQRSYVAVFICFATKAVHLEVVSDLTTNGFIGALKRFVGRRGMCRNLYCDNATNFVGARNQLEELSQLFNSQQHKEEIMKLCTTKGIDFHFIPARAPHFGGLWEAAVKSAKNLLQRTIRSVSLTYEELQTVMVEIEAVLNSRPLTPLSSDPNDLAALTPGHLLIGDPLTSMVDPAANPLKANLLERWKLVSYIKHEFWRRWSKEYLCELQQRYKWKLRSQNIQPGTMVVIKDDNLPPLQWQLGRITEAVKGADGLVRVASVRTSSGILRRPIHALCPLPSENEDENKEDKNQHTTSLNTTCLPVQHKTPRHPLKGRFLPINKNWLQKSKEEKIPQQKHINTKERLETGEPLPKASRISTTALSLFLLTSLILPVYSDSIEPVEITQFSHQPGLYFENLGITNLVANEWNLIVFYDMENYWKEFKSFDKGLKRLSNLCRQMANGEYCKAILSQFYHHMDEIKDNNELLLNRNDSPSTRKKRSPLDIIGNIANKLFGVLDQEYANKASEVIDNLKSNDEYLLLMLKNQTSLIESTANIMKKSQEGINKQFEDFERNLEEILNQISDANTELQNQGIVQLSTALSIYTSLIMSNYQHIQEALIEVVTDTRHGRINPLLLSPKQLKTELAKMKNHLPPTLRLPGPNDQQDLYHLYNLMDVQGEVTSQHIIFNIKLPLFTSEEFEMFRLLPVPVSINNTFMAIEPSTNFLLISLHRDQFYQMSDIEATECVVLEKNNRLCKQIRPIYTKEADVCRCELGLINNQPISSACNIITIKGNQKWIQLFNPNCWIYAVKQETAINIVCGTRIIQRSLKDSGLLKFKENCLIKQELMTISSHNTYPTQVRNSFIPSINLTTHPTLFEFRNITHQSRSQEVKHHQTQLEDITQLQRTIQDIKTHQHLPAKIKSHDIHQFTIGYLALALVIIGLAYITWNQLRSRSTRIGRKDKPVPLPRSTSRQDDFTFQMQELA